MFEDWELDARGYVRGWAGWQGVGARRRLVSAVVRTEAEAVALLAGLQSDGANASLAACWPNEYELWVGRAYAVGPNGGPLRAAS